MAAQQGADATMSADPQTPARRAAAPGGSPVAKRIRAPTEAPATGGAEMSAAQLSQAVHQMNAQSVLDHQWMVVVEEAVSQHAECIDEIRLKAAQLKADNADSGDAGRGQRRHAEGWPQDG